MPAHALLLHRASGIAAKAAVVSIAAGHSKCFQPLRQGIRQKRSSSLQEEAVKSISVVRSCGWTALVSSPYMSPRDEGVSQPLLTCRTVDRYRRSLTAHFLHTSGYDKHLSDEVLWLDGAGVVAVHVAAQCGSFSHSGPDRDSSPGKELWLGSLASVKQLKQPPRW